MDRASDSGSEGRGFEPLQARQPRRYARALAALAALLLLAGTLPTLWRALRYEPLPLAEPEPDGWHEVRVGLHAHSDRSDGIAPPEEVARAAARAGLQVLVLTDHDSPNLRLAREGWVDGVLLLVGIEAGTDAGHLLAIGMQESASRLAPEPEEAVRDVHSRGGLAIITHPTNRRCPWQGVIPDRIDGFEILNGDSQLREAYHRGRLWRSVLYPLAPEWSLLGVLSWPERPLAIWDSLSSQRAVIGTLGLDAHGGVCDGRFRLPYPSYEAIMRLASMHVLLSEPLSGELDLAREQVLGALAAGRAFAVIDGLARAKGFRFEALTAAGSVPQGRSVPAAQGVRLAVRLPESPAIRLALLRDGQPFARREGGGSFEVEAPGPGVYRVEVRLKHPDLPGSERLPWILSNAVRVERPSLPPAPDPEPPLARRWLWTPETSGGLRIEHDASTRVESLQEGARGVRCQLGEWIRGGQDPFCAIADRTPRNLAAYEGLVLQISSERRARVELQVRDSDPRDGRETSWWRATVASQPGGQPQAVSFSRLRPVQQDVERTFRPDRIRSIFVLVDQDLQVPGSGSTFVVERLGVY